HLSHVFMDERPSCSIKERDEHETRRRHDRCHPVPGVARHRLRLRHGELRQCLPSQAARMNISNTFQAAIEHIESAKDAPGTQEQTRNTAILKEIETLRTSR